MEARDRLKRVYELRDALQKAPQSVPNELAVTKLNLEITILDSEQKIELARRARLLLDAWERIGSFTVIRADGARRQAKPTVSEWLD